MKLSGRELFMISGLLVVVMVAAYWFLLLSPIQGELKTEQLTYTDLRARYNSDQSIINSVGGLKEGLTSQQSAVADLENRLLPELDAEVIVEHLATVFVDAGLSCITAISNTNPQTEFVAKADGTYSLNTMKWLTVTFAISGTDGVTEDGGIPKVGYNEFVNALKVIETTNPDAIRISSVSMEDSNQGFQTFTVSINVYAFDLPSRLSPVDVSEPYISWDREPSETGGNFGLSYEEIPVSQLEAVFFRPFVTEVGIPADAAPADAAPADAAPVDAAPADVTATPTP